MRGLAILALLAGCSEPSSTFVCSGNASCRDGDVIGVCEESGFCSFEDASCGEMRRYGAAAAPGLADQCVDLGENPVGSWEEDEIIPVSRYSQAAVTDGTAMYVMGGIQGVDARNDVWITRAASGNFGGIDPWTSSTAMPDARRAFGAAVHGGFVYAIGGNTAANGNAADVIAAPVEGTGIGAWAASSSLPAGIRCHSVVQSGEHVYVVGGKTDNMTGVADVVIGRMSNGSIEWRPGPKMTTARFCGTAVVANGYLYAIGGCPSGRNGCPTEGTTSDLLASVEFAKIEADGSLGPFQLTTPLPVPRWHQATAANSHYLVVAGGHTPSTTRTTDVLVTHVNPDGSLGLWRTSEPLLGPSSRESAVVLGDQIFMISGNTQTATLRSAPPAP